MTPKDSKHLKQAWLLFAEFCAFIALSVILGEYQTIWIHTYSFLGAGIFMALFFLIGSTYLGYLSGLIMVYHVTTMLAFANGHDGYLAYYYPVMLSICSLQIAGLYRGVSYGIKRFAYRRILNDRRDTPRRNYST